MSNPRYSVWNNVRFAIDYGPDYETWHAAKAEVEACWQDRFDQSRIWDHSTTPPTDVTDADPDKKPEAGGDIMSDRIVITTRQRKDGRWSATAKVTGPLGQKVTIKAIGEDTEQRATSQVERDAYEMMIALGWFQEIGDES